MRFLTFVTRTVRDVRLPRVMSILGGVGSATYGLWTAWPPGAWMFGGVFLMVCGFLARTERARE